MTSLTRIGILLAFLHGGHVYCSASKLAAQRGDVSLGHEVEAQAVDKRYPQGEREVKQRSHQSSSHLTK